MMVLECLKEKYEMLYLDELDNSIKRIQESPQILDSLSIKNLKRFFYFQNITHRITGLFVRIMLKFFQIIMGYECVF